MVLNCSIVIVASVEPQQSWSETRLDALEVDLEDRVKTLDKHRGMNTIFSDLGLVYTNFNNFRGGMFQFSKF
jgi:hypothetical protein